MIYLTEGNIPLNAAYDDDIVQEDNSTYQLTFKFPTNDILWQRLREEKFLTADDLHGEQDFVIFEVEKKHGYIQVYANQVMTMLNHYVVNPMSLDRVTGSTALSQFAGSITRSNPFSFFSDIDDRHTFNIDSKTAMEALTKDKHSIVGLWGGDLVRHGYQVRLLKNGGSENESLFMYKKNLSSYEHKTSTKSLRTRITFITTIRDEGENPVDKHYKVVVDSPLINKYSQIYEDVVEVNDQDVKDEASLREYGKQYFRTTLCDMLEDSIEIDVIGQSDVPVQMFDVVGVYHEYYDLDVRKKITKYNYSPMAKKLKSIGFGEFKSGLASAIGNVVSDAVKNETQHLDGIFEAKLAKEIQNADLTFDRKKEELTNQFTDEVNAIKAKAEENKRALSDEIDRRFHDFSPEGFDEAKTKAEEALKKASASADLIEEAKRIADSNTRDLNAFKTATQREREKLSNELKQYSREETQTQITQRFQDFTRDNEAKLSEYKQGVDGQFTTLASQIAEKATQGGPNMLRNSRADDGLKYWTEADGRLGFTAHTFYFNGQKRMFELRPGAIVKSPRFIVKRNADYTFNILGFDNNSKYFRVYFCKRKKGSSADFEEKQLVFDGSPKWTNGPVFSNEKTVKKSFKFNVGDFDDGYLQFEYDRNNPNKWGGLFMTELDFYEGTNDRKWQPSPEDSAEPLEAVRTQVTQKLAEYKETADGRFAKISSQINSKVDQSDFQQVKETSQLYERILGTTEQGVADNASRLVMSSQIFQTEVKKITENSYNLVFDPTNFSKWAKKQAEANIIEVQADTKLLRITTTGKTQAVYHGFALPLNTSTFTKGEKLSYRMEVWVDVLPDAPLGIELWASDGGLASDRVTLTKTGTQIITGTMTINKTTTNSRDYPLEFWLMKNGQVAIGKVSLIRGETPPQEFKDDTSAQDVVTQTKVTQLYDSYAIQTLTNAGAIASQINLNSNDILIEAAKIRLKGRTLLDEITAIDGYFKRLFVGDANIGTLNSDIIRANSITADKLVIDSAMARRFVSSDIFTDTLAAKEAFINKLRSVVVSATLLEGYKGKIGGFQIGTHDKDPDSYWLTGQNQFKVGMGSGNGRWGQTALWVNWGNDWGQPGDTAWYVKNNGEMYCYNQAHFWNTPIIHGNLKVSGNIYYITDDNTKEGGYWIHSPSFKRIQESSGYIYLYRFDNSYSWIPVNKEISDRRYKYNIEDSKVSALEVINRLKTYSYRKEYDGKVEDISCGIMAQDVQQVAPEAFLENPDGAYSYNTFVLLPYLIKAIQELNQKVERLETTT